jgi:hypothetical protein
MVVLLLANDAAAALLLEVTHLGGKAFQHPQAPAYFSASAYDAVTNKHYFINGEGTTADVGKVFTPPGNELDVWARILTQSTPATIQLNAIEQVDDFQIPTSVGLVQQPPPNWITSWNRLAPVKGPNLSGYDITGVEMIVDRFEVTNIIPNAPGGPISTHTGQHTLRIFGEAIPEPSTFALAVVALGCANFAQASAVAQFAQ